MFLTLITAFAAVANNEKRIDDGGNPEEETQCQADPNVTAAAFLDENRQWRQKDTANVADTRSTGGIHLATHACLSLNRDKTRRRMSRRQQ